MSAKKYSILLCGTAYGQSYLPAIFGMNDYQLGAILAQGSARTVKLSEQCGVNNYLDIDEVKEPIDLACVAIGGDDGLRVGMALLEKGIPTLMEHPIGLQGVRNLLNTAAEHQTYCHLNSHFSELLPVSHFIQSSQKLNTRSKPGVISIHCNSRTLFSMIDILMRCFDTSAAEYNHLFTLSEQAITPMNTTGTYQSYAFLLAGIPCHLTYQKWRGEQDDSQDSPLGHQITMTYPDGVLSLGGTFGPCQWFPLLAAGVPLDTPIYTECSGQNKPATLSKIFNWRQMANQQSIQNLQNCYNKKEPIYPYQKTEYLLALCEQWDKLYQQLGVITVSLPK